MFKTGVQNEQKGKRDKERTGILGEKPFLKGGSEGRAEESPAQLKKT